MTWLGFGKRGFLHLYRMEMRRQACIERIRGIEKENQTIIEEIQRLNTDEAYLESVARKELGLVKEDEILYRFGREHNNRQTFKIEKE
jgi:cell division protein FtsB